MYLRILGGRLHCIKKIRIVQSPFNLPLEYIEGIIIKLSVPYSEKDVTVTINPSVDAYKENAESEAKKVRQIMITSLTANTKTLYFDLDNNAKQTVIIKNNSYKIELINISKEIIQGQEFPCFEFSVEVLNNENITRIYDTNEMIREINYLLHNTLDNRWFSSEWAEIEADKNTVVHPFIKLAYNVYNQIQYFIQENKSGLTNDIISLYEMAFYLNRFKDSNISGMGNRLQHFMSIDYSSVRYEIQIAGIFYKLKLTVNFIDETTHRTPDILISSEFGSCEIECKHKNSDVDQLDYIRSIYNNTQTARKQFSKKYPGIIAIEIDKDHFFEFQNESKRLQDEINRALRTSQSISGILLTSKIFLEDTNDYIFRHRSKLFKNNNARYPIPNWLENNLICYSDD